jgi:uncharacterized membrane protein
MPFRHIRTQETIMSSAKSAFSFAAAAAAVALANLAAPTPALAKDVTDQKLVHCYGVNSCKGMSDCKTAMHDCKGQNTCKGHGFKELTSKACAEKGGSETPPKA